MSISTGESRALVGRNGAGKSTLVAVLTGVIAPDVGEIRFGGEPAPRIKERQKWRDHVACVYQKSTLIPELTVAENLFLNSQPGSAGWINWPRLRRDAQQVLGEWGLEVNVDVTAGTLPIEQRHIVEIARALRQGTRFIILDEPTAELEGREVQRLFGHITRLRESGVTFLYISHHLDEIYDVCDSVTVLRDGQEVVTAPLVDMPKERVVLSMVGDAAHGGDLRRRGVSVSVTPDAVSPLEVRHLNVGLTVRDISFRIEAGECVGLTGLASSGKELIADAIAELFGPMSVRSLSAADDCLWAMWPKHRRWVSAMCLAIDVRAACFRNSRFARILPLLSAGG